LSSPVITLANVGAASKRACSRAKLVAVSRAHQAVCCLLRKPIWGSNWLNSRDSGLVNNRHSVEWAAWAQWSDGDRPLE